MKTRPAIFGYVPTDCRGYTWQLRRSLGPHRWQPCGRHWYGLTYREAEAACLRANRLLAVLRHTFERSTVTR